MALTFEQATRRVDQLLRELDNRRPVIDKRERYFDGDQPLAFASDEWQKFHKGRYKEFSDNWCEVVARAAAERQEVFGVRLGDDTAAMSDDERVLWRDWEVNNGPAQSSQGFLSGAITDRSYALVWGDENDEPALTWEHSSQVTIGYDSQTRRPVDALKVWTEDGIEYATLYTADEVWKLERTAETTERRTSSGLVVVSSTFGSSGWRERPSVDMVVDNPLGVVPMVEFPNRPLLKSGPISDIHGTMAMQDAINLFWGYLFTAGDFASMPARVVMGQEPPKMPVLDEQGQKVGEKPIDSEALKNGRMLWLTGQKTTIGQWDAAKLDVFTSVLNVMVKHTASRTRTPIHYIMGELGNVNGDTLTATELPLALKVREGNKHLTHPMREVFRRFALVRGNGSVAEACRTAVVQWKNPETSSDSQTSDAALKDRQIGWPFAAVLENRYGLSQPEIARVLEMREQEGESDPLIRQADRLIGGTADAASGQ